MSYDDVTPINHTPGSEFAAKATGTAGGALKGGLGAALLWIGAAALIGAGVGIFGAALLTGHAVIGLGTAAAWGTGVAGSGLLGFMTNPFVVLGTIGAVVGTAMGAGSSWIPGGIGAIFGGLKGHSQASERVNNERAAAMQMQQAIATQQGAAQGFEADATNKYTFPAQGSPMNMAGGKISAAEYEGVAAGQQLQRA